MRRRRDPVGMFPDGRLVRGVGGRMDTPQKDRLQTFIRERIQPQGGRTWSRDQMGLL